MLNKKILSFLFVIPILAQTDFYLHDNFKKYYEEYNVEGCFLLYNLNNDLMVVYNPGRCSQRFIPASTFKIFNSLVALETGVVKDEFEIIKWDSVNRFYDMWNQDLDMKYAFRYSAVWFYQKVARRIGKEKMQKYISENHYGNENISGGIDHFWLDGELRISPYEQLDFLKKLFNDILLFSKRSHTVVKNIMIFEEGDNYKIKAKTGWGIRLNNNVGWFVGWVEKDDNVYFFVNNCQTTEPDNNYSARIEITKKILSALKILP